MLNELETLYIKYNKKEFIHPDPLEMLYRYQNKEDQEVVGLISSSFAVGNVFQILKFLNSLFDKMGGSPFLYIKTTSEEKISNDFKELYYRYYKGKDIIQFILAIKQVLITYGSIEEWAYSHYLEADETILPLMRRMSKELNLSSSLIPKHDGNSGFKRVALYIRWMVREDRVDLGLWKGIDKSKLLIPLDTHIMNISHILGFTKSRTNSAANALRITDAFRKIFPKDPIKWDFALSRLGIHPDLDYNELITLFSS